MSMFAGEPLDLDIHINIEMRNSVFVDTDGVTPLKMLKISYDTPNSLNSGIVHLRDLDAEIYFGEEQNE